MPAWAAGTFYEIPKTFHCARSVGRNVTQNPKTFCSARRGAPMCAPAPPPCETLSAGGHAGPPLRMMGTSHKIQKRLIPPYGWLARFTECQKRSVVPVWAAGTFYEIPKTFRSTRRGAPLCAPAPPRGLPHRTAAAKSAAKQSAAAFRRRPDRPARRLSERFKLNEVGIARSSVRQTAGDDNVVALLGHAGVFGGDDRVVKKHVGGLKLLAHHRLDAP